MLTVSIQQIVEANREGEPPRSPLILRDKLDAYTITLQNNQPNPVQILSGSVSNHLVPEQAYLKAKQSAGAAYGTCVGKGLVLAPLTLGISLIAEAFLGGPIAANVVDSKNRKLLGYVGQYPGTIPLVTLAPGEQKTLTVLMDKQVKPEVHLSAQDLKTQALYDYP